MKREQEELKKEIEKSMVVMNCKVVVPVKEARRAFDEALRRGGKNVISKDNKIRISSTFELIVEAAGNKDDDEETITIGEAEAYIDI